jgi:hypothetical protein
MPDNRPHDGYSLGVDPDSTWYQYDRERLELMPVRGRDLDLSRPFFSAPGAGDVDLDQGDEAEDEPVDICPMCTVGHHDDCMGTFRLAEDADTLADCDCTAQRGCEGAERAHTVAYAKAHPGAVVVDDDWVEVGYTEGSVIDGVLRLGGGPVYMAPAGTPPPGIPHGLEHRRLDDTRHVTVDELHARLADLDQAGQRRADWLNSIAPPAPIVSADNESYVNQTVDYAGQGAVSGLTREHIVRRQEVPRPLPFTLPAGLGGLPEPAEDAGEDDGPVRYVANRRDRRRLAKRTRRG